MPETTEKPLVAFVVLAWNSESYIGSCVSSVCALRSVRPLLYVVDNGSSDGTGDAIREAGGNQARVIRLEKNVGTTVSRNKVLRDLQSEVDYVCVLDSDTVVNDAAIAEMVCVLADDESIGLVGPTLSNSAGVVQLSGRALPTAGIKLRKICPLASVARRGEEMERPSAPAVDGLQDVGYLLSACWVCRRTLLDEVGLLDEHIFYAPEDVDYCVRVHQAGYRVVYCSRVGIIHECQRLTRKKPLSGLAFSHGKGLVYYFKKHHYLFDSSGVWKGL